MFSFSDEAYITVSSGKGGNGCISFRREKFVPRGGPSGGDGGKGGDVIFCVKQNMRTLSALRYKKTFKAQNGQDGMGRQRYGKDGDDLFVYVPPGTSIFDVATGKLLKDFGTSFSSSKDDSYFLCLEGGKGGWGNLHFKSSVNQAPRYAHEGKAGKTLDLRIELSIMADVGLVGFPNAGKSSLLDAFTNARPKIAPYPFTTKIPNLGVLSVNQGKNDARDIVIADIPGIIEGAALGAGLGHKFLKHIKRTQCLIYMIDVSQSDFLLAFDTLQKELKDFDEELCKKPFIVLCNKIDIQGAYENALILQKDLKKRMPDIDVLCMSVKEHYGQKDASCAVLKLIEKQEAILSGKGLDIKTEIEKRASDFLSSRSIDTTAQEQFPGQEVSS